MIEQCGLPMPIHVFIHVFTPVNQGSPSVRRNNFDSPCPSIKKDHSPSTDDLFFCCCWKPWPPEMPPTMMGDARSRLLEMRPGRKAQLRVTYHSLPVVLKGPSAHDLQCGVSTWPNMARISKVQPLISGGGLVARFCKTFASPLKPKC